uniref:Extracellular ribonuclease LE n=1 Tax=Anthurium amnicola TaxID=1678845 RepID=A0A1D1XXX4_9ARAE
MEKAVAPRLALPFLLVATLLASSLVMADKSFDFYILILQWPGTYCAQSKRCCKPTTGYPAKDFFIRSLEAYDEIAGKPLSKCNKWPFDVNQVVDERSELQQYWSSIRCPSNDGVSSWKYTWVNYGVCSNLTQPHFFSTALQLRAKVDVLSALANKGDESATYSYQDLNIKFEKILFVLSFYYIISPYLTIPSCYKHGVPLINQLDDHHFYAWCDLRVQF